MNVSSEQRLKQQNTQEYDSFVIRYISFVIFIARVTAVCDELFYTTDKCSSKQN